MEDREFFDHLYQVFARTTGASNHYWMYEEDEEAPVLNNLYAVDEQKTRKHVASAVRDEDADFITAVHGAFPDLVRRLHRALDEADRYDAERDELTCRVAELEQEVDRLKAELKEAERTIEGLGLENTRLERELTRLQ